MKLFNDFEYINLFNSKRTRIAEMSLIFKCLFLACQTLPLNSSPHELQEEELGVTDRFLKDEISVKMDQNDNDNSLAQIDGEKPLENADRLDKVPMFIHLTVDQINEMQAEQNSNFDFSRNVYVNLNSACNLESITQLVAFLILTLM